MEFSLENLKSRNNKNQMSVSGKTGALAAMKSGKLIANTNKEEISKKVNTYAAAVIDETTEIMNNTRTDLVFIIDRSTSTIGLEGATCAGYNALIAKEKQEGLCTKVTTVLFDEAMEVASFRDDISNISPLAYRAGGSTALYESLCRTIKSVRDAQIRDGLEVKHTLVYIMTDDDGDTASHEYNEHSTRKLIKEYQELGWTFLFLGAIKNAKKIAADLGIDYKNAIEIDKTQEGMYNSFVSTSQALDDLRTYGKLTDNWARASKQKNNMALDEKNQKRLELK